MPKDSSIQRDRDKVYTVEDIEELEANNKNFRAWHRLPDENSASYQYFMRFANLPVEVRKVSLFAQQAGKGVNYFRTMSHKYKWTYRARKYSEYLFETSATSAIETKTTFFYDLQSAQQFTLDTGYEDASALREVWKELLQEQRPNLTVQDLKTMIASRKTIDDMLRRASHLPTSVSGTVGNVSDQQIKEDEPTTYVLGAVKPIRQDFIDEYDDGYENEEDS